MKYPTLVVGQSRAEGSAPDRLSYKGLMVDHVLADRRQNFADYSAYRSRNGGPQTHDLGYERATDRPIKARPLSNLFLR